MKQLVMERECLGHPVRVQIDIPADGLAVLLTGGCKPHIGAVSARRARQSYTDHAVRRSPRRRRQ